MTASDAEDGSDAAALAFAALRAEVFDLRGAVEARGPDYSPTLGTLAASLDAVSSRLELIERHTGSSVPAEVARREIARVYDTSLRPARSDLERAAREVQGIAQGLEETVGRIRGRHEQRARLVRTGFLAAAAGFVAFPLLAFPLARALPFGHLPDRLEAAALGADPWSAGAELMSHADPG